MKKFGSLHFNLITVDPIEEDGSIDLNSPILVTGNEDRLCGYFFCFLLVLAIFQVSTCCLLLSPYHLHSAIHTDVREQLNSMVFLRKNLSDGGVLPTRG